MKRSVRRTQQMRFVTIEELGWKTLLGYQKVSGNSDIPVPAVAVAESMGLNCLVTQFARSQTRLAALLVPAQKIIQVNDQATHHERRFAVAHELGHWCLGHMSKLQKSSRGAKDRSARCLSNELRQASANIELEANLFAASLVMPLKYLREYVQAYEEIDVEPLRELASKFDVSVHAMFYRLDDLVYYSEWKGPTIKWRELASYKSHIEFSHKSPPLSVEETQVETRQHLALAWISKMQSRALGIATRKSQSLALPNTRSYKVSRKFAWPIFFEVAGTPNAGKDTVVIPILEAFLRDILGFQVKTLSEAITYCRIDRKFEVDRLWHSINLTSNLALEAFREPGNNFIVQNRGLFDRLAFVHAFRAAGQIDAATEGILRDGILLCQKYIKVEIVFLFMVGQEISIQRETREVTTPIVKNLKSRFSEGSVESKPSMVNPQSLDRLNSAYEYARNEYAKHFNIVMVPDPSNAKAFSDWLISVDSPRLKQAFASFEPPQLASQLDLFGI